MPEERIQDRGVKRRWLSAIMSRLQLTTAFGAFVVCVAIANVCLLLENRMLETRLASIESRDTQITLGRRLSPITGVNLDGWLERVPTGTPLLIFSFSPGCPASQANHQGWARLDERLHGGERKVVWISRDPLPATRDYLANHRLLGVVLTDVPYPVYAQLALRLVPQTTAIGRDGVVEQVWSGKIGDTRWREIDEFIRIGTDDAARR
jgi:hypothetical protein